jgi:hypothetical protein
MYKKVEQVFENIQSSFWKFSISKNMNTFFEICNIYFKNSEQLCVNAKGSSNETHNKRLTTIN